MARPVTPPPASGGAGRWWIAPAVVVGLVLIGWLVMLGMPFGRDEGKPKPAAVPTDTVAEAEPPAQSSTLIEVPAGAADESFEISTTTTAEPPMAQVPAGTAEATPPGTATTPPPGATPTPVQRPPVVVAQQPQPRPVQPQPRPVQPQPRPVQPQPRPAPPQPVQRPPVVAQQPAPVRVVPRPAAEITSDEATATLRNYVRATRYYPVASECIRVENRGYKNVGYNLEVWHSCEGGGASRLLGRWRVDSKTREVFRQREDGRFLRP
ncbi:MAG TPA: hypothetical protein VND45_01015 [Thermoanaerobaculia bacterium]|nr:hypothetical protein [Thermoanaerobaculia bacterium]